MIARDSNSEGEPWVIASLLRDYLLSPKERKDLLLWKKVEELVREDSRLELYPKVVKGEPKVVWEWQGMNVCSN
nr:putative inner nuclear membrane protein [Ipomoea batatas]